MSRFNSEAYDKLFPRPEVTPPVVETAVEGFTPSSKKEDPEQDKKDTVQKAEPILEPEQPDVSDKTEPEQPDPEVDDGV